PPTGATVFPVDLSVGGERVRASSAQPWTWDDFTRPATPASWGTTPREPDGTVNLVATRGASELGAQVACGPDPT
ncbi:hypothetical protein G5C65_28340, partial [Streptomyces sp. SB3404]|nr:hypothetical protein [Streptomyces boncukensis]